MFCQFIKISDTEYLCSACGTTAEVIDHSSDTPIIPCSNPFKNEQLNINKLKNQLDNDIDKEDLCSDIEIEHRYVLCSGCEFFTNNTCSKCGCILNRYRVHLNKLAIKNEKCPMNKW